MESNAAYLPQDRLIAIAANQYLPDEAQGCVLFADISGFTPLTEAYESHLGSRLGGERLTLVLNEVYSMLIDEVERQRGSVIGFAGDAITCWFDGDSGDRTVASAFAMQKGMQRFSKIRSPDGQTKELRLKAAATFGKVKRFYVGDSKVQLVDVLAGEPVYRVAQIESLAEPGEVLVGEELRRNLGERVSSNQVRYSSTADLTVHVIDSFDLVPETVPWPSSESLNLPPEQIDPWLISAIRERLTTTGLGDFFTELRPATALFLKFEGIDFENDPASVKKLDEFFSVTQKTVNSFGGIVHQLTLGDKGSFLYAAFGAPVSHEDDTRRAMATALSLRTAAKALPYVESIRIGIARGSTRTGAYGGQTRRTYGVLGDIVNLAARLMGAAKPNEILVSKRAAQETEKDFALKKLPPIRVKGKAEPVAIFSLENVLDSTHRRKARPAYSLPLVGRVKEQKQIAAWFDQSCRGTGRTIEITGDAGMGKTRLMEAAIEIAQQKGFRIFYGECQTFGANTLYTPWWGIWREYFGVSDRKSLAENQARIEEVLGRIDKRIIERAPVLSPVLNLSIPDNELTKSFDAKVRRASLESLLVDCIRYGSQEAPYLLVIEDAQAIDPVSQELLGVFIQAIARLKVSILFAARPSSIHSFLSHEAADLDYVHSMVLKELNEEEGASFIKLKHSRLFGPKAEIPEHVVQQISSRTGRNPFYIEEIVNWIHQEGIDVNTSGGLDAIELPDSLHSLVLSRMDQLNESSRATLKVASVVGRLFRAAIVWGSYPELGGKAPVLDSLETLTSSEFTERDEKNPELAYLFRHVVMHEVAYESLPTQLRAKLHELIGLFIESNFKTDTIDALDLLAFHFGRTENKEKKLKYYLLAADAASRAYSSKAAERYYRSAIALMNEYDQVPVLRSLGRVLEFASDWAGATEIYQTTLALSEHLGRRRNIAYSKLSIGDILRKQGKFEQASEWLKNAADDLQTLEDEAGIGQALHSLGTLAAQTGDYGRALELYNQSTEIRKKLGDNSKVASLMSNMGIIARFRGNIDEALRLQKESLSIRKSINDAWAVGNSLNNLGMALRYMGDYEGAKEHLLEALKVLKKVGDRNEISNTYTSLAEVALDQKDTESSELYLKKGLRLAREVGNLRAIAYLFEAFATNEHIKENFERCLTLIGAASELRRSIGAPLPKDDQAKLDSMQAEAVQNCDDPNPQSFADKGVAMGLSRALDFANAPPGESSYSPVRDLERSHQ